MSPPKIPLKVSTARSATGTVAPRWRVGDHVFCTNHKCRAGFKITTEATAAETSLTCPNCRSRLHLAAQSPAPEPLSDLSSLFDEELPRNRCDLARRQLGELLALEAEGVKLTLAKHQLKLQLIAQCRTMAPLSCPKCSAGVSVDAIHCTACGLHFRAGHVIQDVTKPGVLALQRAKEQMERDEKIGRALLARAETLEPPKKSNSRLRFFCISISAVGSMVVMGQASGHFPVGPLELALYSAPGALLMFVVFEPLLGLFDN